MFHHVIHLSPVFSLVIYLLVHYFNCYFIRTNGLRNNRFFFLPFFISLGNFRFVTISIWRMRRYSIPPIIRMAIRSLIYAKTEFVLEKNFVRYFHIYAVLLIYAMLTKKLYGTQAREFSFADTSLRVNFRIVKSFILKIVWLLHFVKSRTNENVTFFFFSTQLYYLLV